jgi:hypothetical protein
VEEQPRRLGLPSMAESQLADLRKMRVLLEEARVISRNLAYHRRAVLERKIGRALDELDQQIEELRALGG